MGSGGKIDITQMITLVVIAIAFYILYTLFVKGVFYGIALFVGGVVGLRLLFLSLLPQSAETLLTIAGHEVSYATCGAIVLSVLGIGYYLQKGSE
jgi:hypothetical protein